ncbi:hypothetical protein LTSESEN_2904 [Salmonella enterica subsp. enterica serovar Senftenberg str. A4-543]|uniref:Uncharacterized protein n=1 Tax=Salmonella enterica subsp. enterica serovar Senftenberg str. A4-543 TaxID=913082 RepID=G5R0V5_SALSE|nr:hypothetical protein LTSESEN_2904 [Salmonella enterica subsp. enterica serovar Senftenberg str. A4-543]
MSDNYLIWNIFMSDNYLFLLWQKENIPPHDKVLRLVQYS